MRAPDTGRLDSHQYFSLAAHWPHDIHEWDNLRCAEVVTRHAFVFISLRWQLSMARIRFRNGPAKYD